MKLASDSSCPSRRAGTHGSKPKGETNTKDRTNGPNFDSRKETYQSAITAIRQGGFSGAIMPGNIVTGQDQDNRNYISGRVSILWQPIDHFENLLVADIFNSHTNGSSNHLSGELFQKLTGTKMVHVPYRGSAQAVQDLMGGRVDLIFDNITSSLPQAKSGTIRGLGVTTAKRAPTAPEYPPIAETVPGFDVSSWFALFAPAKTPQAIIDKIQADTKAGVADPALRAKMDALAAEPGGWAPAELGTFLQSELTKWGGLIKETGIKAD